MRDTPRTDTVLVAWDLTPEPKVLIEHARQLERELNAANERIKQLEEIIDRAANRFFDDGSDRQTAVEMLMILEEVRKAKP